MRAQPRSNCASPSAVARRFPVLDERTLVRESEAGSVSKIENAADMYLTTLRKYVEAMGGELHLTATFAGGRSFEIDHVAALVEE